MYEVTYDTYLNEERDLVLQPLANVSFISTNMDGYTESGSGDAALNVDEQEMTVGTIAIGVRLMGKISQNALGRESFGELRINVAQEVGDENSETVTGFHGYPGVRRTIRGAEEGQTAIQIGAGFCTEVNEGGMIFVDVNADFRADMTSYNGAIGYKYTF